MLVYLESHDIEMICDALENLIVRIGAYDGDESLQPYTSEEIIALTHHLQEAE